MYEVSPISHPFFSRRAQGFALLTLACLAALPARAQETPSSTPAPHAGAEAALLLPEAPSWTRAMTQTSSSVEGSASSKSVAAPSSSTHMLPAASLTQVVIEPGQDAPALDARHKALVGLKSAVSPFAAAGWVISGGYSHLTNGSPNYGTDRGAFGQRIGANAIRDASEEFLGAGILSSVFHEDPRYYRLGPQHGLFPRILYTVTRPLITRTDSGARSANLSLISGTLAASAMTNIYYPASNRGATETFKTFGGSLAGEALGDFVKEFGEDALALFHLGHR